MFYAEPSKFRYHNDGDAGAAMRYDSVYLTYSQTLIRTQRSLYYVKSNKNLNEKRTKINRWTWWSPVQSNDQWRQSGG